jgi:putative two-component system response regulator
VSSTLPIEAPRILVVDDAPTNLVILAQTLAQNNYRIIEADCGEAALRQVSNDLPDLILLDIMMPDIDGIEVCRRLKKDPRTANIPVIFLTGADDTENLMAAFAAGGVDYLTKPFRTAELLSRVRTHIDINFLRGHLESEVARRTQELSDAMHKLERANIEILNRLTLAAELKDEETANHLKRMSFYSVILGTAIGMPEEKLKMLSLASTMHDVGKIGIPDSILLKLGKLTVEEFEIMKTHPKIGEQLLSGLESDHVQMAASIAISHHEKFDGSGYLNGLAGEAIPLEGRIVAIADVFDALTSARPYKEAWPIDKAVQHIKDGSGKHFDPQLVSHFVSSLPLLLKIHTEFSD